MKKALLQNLLVMILMLTASYKAFAQDPHFSQFYASSLYLNPALAGIEGDLTLSVVHRVQWRSVLQGSQPYSTNKVSIIAPVSSGKYIKNQIGSIGATVFNDVAGDGNFNTLGGSFTYAHNFESNSQLQLITLAGQIGFIQKSIDFTNLEWGSQFQFSGVNSQVPEDQSMINSQKLYPDVNLGIMYYFNPEQNWRRAGYSFYVGGAIYHLNNPNESLVEGQVSRLPSLLKLHGGLELTAGDKMTIAPEILTMNQNSLFDSTDNFGLSSDYFWGNRTQVNLGLYVNYRMFEGPRGPAGLLTDTDLLLGSWYRLGDAYIASIGLSNANYTVGFSYDLNTSSLRYQTGGRGAYEISLSIRNATDKKRRKFDTPRI